MKSNQLIALAMLAPLLHTNALAASPLSQPTSVIPQDTADTAVVVPEDLIAPIEVEEDAEPIPPAEEPVPQEEVVQPAQALVEAEVLEAPPAPVLLAPIPQPVNSQPISPLRRPIGLLTMGAEADAQLLEQMEKIPPQFAINNAAEGHFGDWDAPLYDASHVQTRHALTGFSFAAPASYSRPLYFEQENLERYGHYAGLYEKDLLTQSAVSTAHFFATAAVLPYKMGAHHPDECSYVLGAYRPGSCNPHQLLRPRLSLQGLAWQGAVVTGLVFLVP